jgi:hypothetical protein
MSEHLATLVEGVGRWRQLSVTDYWIRVGFLGGDLEKVGEHEVTHAEDKLWHSKDGGDWVEVKQGSYRWLFGVEGAFVWTKDLITKVLPKAEAGADTIELRINEDFGYIEYLRLQLAKRDAENLTFEVKGFGLGKHPEL